MSVIDFKIFSNRAKAVFHELQQGMSLRSRVLEMNEILAMAAFLGPRFKLLAIQNTEAKDTIDNCGLII